MVLAGGAPSWAMRHHLTEAPERAAARSCGSRRRGEEAEPYRSAGEHRSLTGEAGKKRGKDKTPHPWRYIALVPRLGDDDLVAWPQRGGDAVGEVVQELGRARAESSTAGAGGVGCGGRREWGTESGTVTQEG